MRADSRPQPPALNTGRKRSPGRPGYYGPDELREVWLFVQEAMARRGLSASRVCRMLALAFCVAGRGGPHGVHVPRGETLRSLYHRAARLLKAEREEHEAFLRALALAGARSARAGEPLPLAAFWHGELRRRLAGPG